MLLVGEGLVEGGVHHAAAAGHAVHPRERLRVRALGAIVIALVAPGEGAVALESSPPAGPALLHRRGGEGHWSPRGYASGMDAAPVLVFPPALGPLLVSA